MRLRTRLRVALEALRAIPPMLLIELSLRTSDLPATCRRLGLACDMASAAPAPAAVAVLPHHTRARVTATLFVASRWPAGDTCLRRCLLLGHRLRALRPVLRIGVRRDSDGEFWAHSWLEIGDATLDPSATGYSVLGAATSEVG